MNVRQALDEILRTIKRPDKEVEALSALNAAVSFFTIRGEFSKDLVETSLNIDPSSYGSSIDISTLERFRRFKYVKLVGEKGYLTPTDPTKIFHPTGSMKVNTYYVAGSNLTYILSKLGASLEVGYMVYAPALTVYNTHWMLDMAPQMIIDWACGRMFRDLGDDGSADRHDGYANGWFKILLNDQAAGE